MADETAEAEVKLDAKQAIAELRRFTDQLEGAARGSDQFDKAILDLRKTVDKLAGNYEKLNRTMNRTQKVQKSTFDNMVKGRNSVSEFGGEMATLGSILGGSAIPGAEGFGRAVTVLGDTVEGLTRPLGAAIAGVGAFIALQTGAYLATIALVSASRDWMDELEDVGRMAAVTDFVDVESLETAHGMLDEVGVQAKALGVVLASELAPAFLVMAEQGIEAIQWVKGLSTGLGDMVIKARDAIDAWRDFVSGTLRNTGLLVMVLAPVTEFFRAQNEFLSGVGGAPIRKLAEALEEGRERADEFATSLQQLGEFDKDFAFGQLGLPGVQEASPEQASEIRKVMREAERAAKQLAREVERAAQNAAKELEKERGAWEKVGKSSAFGSKSLNETVKAAKAVAEHIDRSFEDGKKAIIDGFGDAQDQLVAEFEEMLDRTARRTKTIVDAILNPEQGVSQAFGLVGRGLGAMMGGPVGATIGAEIGKALPAMKNLDETVMQAVDGFADVLSNTLPGILGDAIPALIGQLDVIVIKLIEGLVEGLGKTAKKAGKRNPITPIFALFDKKFIPQQTAGGTAVPGASAFIPGFAGGGVVTRPTLAMLGENGPERVTPMGFSGGGGVTVNINGDVIGTLRQDLIRSIQRQLDLSKRNGTTGLVS